MFLDFGPEMKRLRPSVLVIIVRIFILLDQQNDNILHEEISNKITDVPNVLASVTSPGAMTHVISRNKNKI